MYYARPFRRLLWEGKHRNVPAFRSLTGERGTRLRSVLLRVCCVLAMLSASANKLENQSPKQLNNFSLKPWHIFQKC